MFYHSVDDRLKRGVKIDEVPSLPGTYADNCDPTGSTNTVYRLREQIQKEINSRPPQFQNTTPNQRLCSCNVWNTCSEYNTWCYTVCKSLIIYIVHLTMLNFWNHAIVVSSSLVTFSRILTFKCHDFIAFDSLWHSHCISRCHVSFLCAYTCVIDSCFCENLGDINFRDIWHCAILSRAEWVFHFSCWPEVSLMCDYPSFVAKELGFHQVRNVMRSLVNLFWHAL